MKCPKCMSENTSPVGNTHYVCNNPTCKTDGNQTQFRVVNDETIQFPMNIIFNDRSTHEFYRKPYLIIKGKRNKKNK